MGSEGTWAVVLGNFQQRDEAVHQGLLKVALLMVGRFRVF